MAKDKDASTTIEIPRINKETRILNILGTSPLILNRMSEKAQRELLLPSRKKNTTEKAITLKHDPIAEFRASPYLVPREDASTLLAVMASAFKGAMCTAALDLPGTKKAQIGRLVYVEGDYVPVFGTPRLLMSVVRMADISHTPDIRSRAILPVWGCKLAITFVEPLLKAQAIVNLLSAAGVTVGIGDWRPEKGKGNYGQFMLVNDDDPEFQSVLTQDREAQKQAMREPAPYDLESADLLSWFQGEAKRRDFVIA